MKVTRENLENWISTELGTSIKEWFQCQFDKSNKEESELIFFRDLINRFWISDDKHDIIKEELEHWANQELNELIDDCRALKDSRSTKKYGNKGLSFFYGLINHFSLQRIR